MIAEQYRGAHSANVGMRLLVDGTSIGITHMGPDFLLLESSNEHPPGTAVVVLQVDQSERQWPVRLPDGIRPGQKRIPISK
jgi:hypothetical protein